MFFKPPLNIFGKLVSGYISIYKLPLIIMSKNASHVNDKFLMQSVAHRKLYMKICDNR